MIWSKNYQFNPIVQFDQTAARTNSRSTALESRTLYDISTFYNYYWVDTYTGGLSVSQSTSFQTDKVYKIYIVYNIRKKKENDIQNTRSLSYLETYYI